MTIDHPVAPEVIEIRLDDQAVDVLAGRIAERLNRNDRPGRGRATPGAGEGRLLSAAQVAEWWQVDRAWVYAHAKELGARPLGTGPRPRLRFDPDEVQRRLAPPPPERTDGKGHVPRDRSDGRRSGRTLDDSGELLPFRGDAELSSKDRK